MKRVSAHTPQNAAAFLVGVFAPLPSYDRVEVCVLNLLGVFHRLSAFSRWPVLFLGTLRLIRIPRVVPSILAAFDDVNVEVGLTFLFWLGRSTGR